MEMYSLLDKLYDGLDVQAGGLCHMGDSRAILRFHSDSRDFTFLQKIAYPCMGKMMSCSVLGLTE